VVHRTQQRHQHGDRRLHGFCHSFLGNSPQFDREENDRSFVGKSDDVPCLRRNRPMTDELINASMSWLRHDRI
jgi:hypothetical protein